ncbi:hypothetical protein [Sphingobium yanoikuyae]|nr:hypothetical protein [Sphingobium yanoikuyae]
MFVDTRNFIKPGFGIGQVDMGVVRSMARDVVLNAQTHHMDRNEYLARLFVEQNLASLPIGHLMDHRIHMPGEFALSLENKDEEQITELLDHMLCAQPHSEARLLLANALNVRTAKLAADLIAIRKWDKALFFQVISGHLGQALDHLSTLNLTSVELTRTQSCVADMLVVYSAFELQLIAARAVALDAGSFLPFDYSDMKERAPLELMSDIADAYQYRFRQSELKTKNLPLGRGRPPVLASKFNEDFAREIAKSIGLSEKDEDGKFLKLSKELHITFGDIKSTIDKIKKSPSFDIRKNEDNSNFKSTPASTYFFEISFGIQLAFAALRIVNLSKRKMQMTSTNPIHRKNAFQAWRSADLPAKRQSDATTILFVIRTVILQDSQAGTAFYSDGKNISLLPQINSHNHDGNVAGISLLTRAKRGYPVKSAKNRECVPLDANLSLAGVQEIDLLPDYRIGLNRKSSTSMNRVTKPRVGYDQPSRTKYKLERRSRSNPRAPGRFG